MRHTRDKHGPRAFRSARTPWTQDMDMTRQARGPFGPEPRHEHEGGHRRGFGPGGGGPRGRGPGGRGRRGRARGDIRAAVLVLLAEQPRHGYDLIQAVDERTAGAWRPSPGSIYPILQVLEDEGLIGVETVDGRKTASLTDAGREWIAAHPVETASVFTPAEGADKARALREEMHLLRDAAMHVARQPDLTEPAAAILAAARKDLYRLLAGDAS